MSKDQARSPKSYENEELLLAMLPGLLEHKGFAGVTTVRTGGMKSSATSKTAQRRR